MGIDACIYFKTRSGSDLSDVALPDGCTIHRIEPGNFIDCTHHVINPWRYYSPNYARGNWPMIAALLMELRAHTDVESVYYFGDNVDDDDPFTMNRILEFCSFYMQHGNRPYFLRRC